MQACCRLNRSVAPRVLYSLTITTMGLTRETKVITLITTSSIVQLCTLSLVTTTPWSINTRQAVIWQLPGRLHFKWNRKPTFLKTPITTWIMVVLCCWSLWKVASGQPQLIDIREITIIMPPSLSVSNRRLPRGWAKSIAFNKSCETV